MAIESKDMLGQDLSIGDLITVAVASGKSPMLTIDRVTEITDSVIITERLFPHKGLRPIRYIMNKKILKLGEDLNKINELLEELEKTY